MLKQAHAISEELIEWRRDFHMHPELGFELHRTSKIVADELEKMGYRVKRGVGKTGVVAEIGEGGKVVAIRADMDALPILEQNEYEYVSQNKGAMHACGHDSAYCHGTRRSIIIIKRKTCRDACAFSSSPAKRQQMRKARAAHNACLQRAQWMAWIILLHNMLTRRNLSARSALTLVQAQAESIPGTE